MILYRFIQKLNILSSKCYSPKAYPSVLSIPSPPRPPANLVSHKQLDGRIDSVSYLVVKINVLVFSPYTIPVSQVFHWS